MTDEIPSNTTSAITNRNLGFVALPPEAMEPMYDTKAYRKYGVSEAARCRCPGPEQLEGACVFRSPEGLSGDLAVRDGSRDLAPVQVCIPS